MKVTVQERPPLYFIQLPPDLRAAQRAREYIREFCSIEGVETVGDAELLVSEVVTNALRHGDPSVELAFEPEGSTLRVWVRNQGTAGRQELVPGQAPVDAEGGRGLLLLDALSDSWGVHNTAGWTCVWFTVPLVATMDLSRRSR